MILPEVEDAPATAAVSSSVVEDVTTSSTSSPTRSRMNVDLQLEDVEVDSMAISESPGSHNQQQTRSTILSRLGSALMPLASSFDESTDSHSKTNTLNNNRRIHATYSNRQELHTQNSSIYSQTHVSPLTIDCDVDPEQQKRQADAINKDSPFSHETTDTHPLSPSSPQSASSSSFLAPIVPARPHAQSCLTKTVRTILGCGIVTGTFCVDRHAKHYEHTLLSIQERAEFSELCNRIDAALQPTNKQFTRYAARQQVVGLCAVALVVLAICLCIEGAASTTQKSLLYYTTMGFVACCLVLLLLQRCVSGIHVQRSWNEGMDDLERLLIRENRARYKVFRKLTLETTISPESLTAWGMACMCQPVPLAIRIYVQNHDPSPREHALQAASPTRRKIIQQNEQQQQDKQKEEEEKKEDV